MRVLVTGSNRGIGLEFVRQYLEDGWVVHATCRWPGEAHELQTFAQIYSELHIHRLDITIQEDISNICRELDGIPLDVLINNAGIYLDKKSPGLDCIHYDDWRRTIEVNTLGAVRLTEAMVENIARSKKKLVVVLSSHMGSIEDINAPGSYYYRSSKAALNAVMHGISVELKKQLIGVQILHPGGVMTRMGPEKGITPQQSVQGMRDIIEHFSLDQTGTFLQYNGDEMPW